MDRSLPCADRRAHPILAHILRVPPFENRRGTATTPAIGAGGSGIVEKGPRSRSRRPGPSRAATEPRAPIPGFVARYGGTRSAISGTRSAIRCPELVVDGPEIRLADGGGRDHGDSREPPLPVRPREALAHQLHL